MKEKLQPKLLLLELANSVSASVNAAIDKCSFEVMRAKNVERAIVNSQYHLPNLLIIDSDGELSESITIANNIRQKLGKFKLPVIIVSSGLNECNADEYTKIISRSESCEGILLVIKEFLAKIQSTLEDKLLQYGEILMDLSRFQVKKSGVLVKLGPTEFEILKLFLKHPNKIYARSDIINEIWGQNYEIEPRTVDVHINRIRKAFKYKKVGGLINTIRSSGYILDIAQSSNYPT